VGEVQLEGGFQVIDGVERESTVDSVDITTLAIEKEL